MEVVAHPHRKYIDVLLKLRSILDFESGTWEGACSEALKVLDQELKNAPYISFVDVAFELPRIREALRPFRRVTSEMGRAFSFLDAALQLDDETKKALMGKLESKQK